MAVMNFLLNPITKKKKADFIFSCAFMAVFLAAMLYLTFYFEMMLPAMIVVLALLAFMFFRLKLYSIITRIPIIYHIILLMTGAYWAVYLYQYTEGATAKRLIFSASCAAAISFICEMLFGLLISKVADKPNPKNFVKAIASAFPLFFTLFVFIPSETYFLNQKDFLFIFFDFAPYIFIKTIVFTLISSVAACALRKSVFRIVSSASVGATLCIYCQYMFMNKELPTTVGEGVDWNLFKGKYALNIIIWIVLFLLPIIFVILSDKVKFIAKHKAAKNAHLLVTCFIGAIQLVSLVVLMISSQRSLFNHSSYYLNSSEQFVVSGKKNIITFVLDTADINFFESAYEKEPEKFDFLHDFTCYTNACMMYDSTYISIPQMLTGSEELPETDLNHWSENIWKSEKCESFYSRLHEENYKVNAFGKFSHNFTPYSGKIDNCTYYTEDMITVNRKNVIEKINSLSAYRYMPLMFKQYYEHIDDSLDYSISVKDSCIHDNTEFYNNLKLTKSEDDKNYFILEHLIGTHLMAHGARDYNLNMCLDIIKSYTDQLKEMGLYDDAVIIVTADHGEHFNKDNLPIFYIKPANTHQDKMKFSNAPIHHTDYLATCIESAGLKRDGDEKIFGSSIFDIGENDQRKRLVFQRNGFEFVGDIDFKKNKDPMHTGSLYGYYFTGDRKDLVRREQSGPPDIVIELNEGY